MEDTDAQLQLKKRARRRLVGALAFVVLVAVTLPMIMDHEPKPAVQDVEIRIPGQDEKPFAPKFATAPLEKPTAKPAEPVVEPKPAEPAATPVKPDAKPSATVVEAPLNKPAEKSPEKAPAKPEKPVEKPAEKPAAKDTGAEAKRAAAILADKPAEPAAAKGGEQVILIGAFANEANVKNIRNKLGDLGIKVYTEPLDSPQGRKTRVRAGPFANREAAEKALEKMKRIGVAGVIAAKQ